jgi:predicted GIY-YIG superfamily endonuclease
MLKNIVINNFKITFCIYAIRCNKTQQVYIGATSNIQSRISNHISSYKSGNSKCSSRTIFEHDDYTIDILLNDLTKEEAIQSENDFIVAYGKMAVNQNKPILNIDMKTYYKEYYKNNKHRYKKDKKVITDDTIFRVLGIDTKKRAITDEPVDSEEEIIFEVLNGEI